MVNVKEKDLCMPCYFFIKTRYLSVKQRASNIDRYITWKNEILSCCKINVSRSFFIKYFNSNNPTDVFSQTKKELFC